MDQPLPKNLGGTSLPPQPPQVVSSKVNLPEEFKARMFRKGQSGNPAGKKPGQLNLVNEQLRRAFLKLKIGKKTALDEIWTLALERARKGDDALLIELLKRVTVLASPELAGVTNIQINQGTASGASPGAGSSVVFNPTPEQLVTVIGLASRLRMADLVVQPHEPGIVDAQAVEVIPAGGNGNGNGGNGHGHEEAPAP